MLGERLRSVILSAELFHRLLLPRISSDLHHHYCAWYPRGKARTSDITTVDLGLRKDRIANNRHLIDFFPSISCVGWLCAESV